MCALSSLLTITLKYSVPYIWLQGLPDAHSSSLYVVVFVERERTKFHWCAAASEFDTPASDRQMKFIVYIVITLFCFLLLDWANCSDSWHSSGGIQLRIDIIDSPLLLSWHDFHIFEVPHSMNFWEQVYDLNCACVTHSTTVRTSYCSCVIQCVL